jgi:hypothetical protein
MPCFWKTQISWNADASLITLTHVRGAGSFGVEVEFWLLTIYVRGMRVDASQELKFIVPSSLDEALNIATVLHAAKINKEDVEKYIGLELFQMLADASDPNTC